MERKKKGKAVAALIPRITRIQRIPRITRLKNTLAAPSAKFEFALVDFQGFDSGFEC
jgi:hypothetical protein